MLSPLSTHSSGLVSRTVFTLPSHRISWVPKGGERSAPAAAAAGTAMLVTPETGGGSKTVGPIRHEQQVVEKERAASHLKSANSRVLSPRAARATPSH